MQSLPGIQSRSPRNIEAYRGKNDPEAIKAVAKEMEALFAYELIKVMRETTDMPSQGAFGNDTYMSMFDMELSRLFAERGLGLQESLEKGLSSIARIAEKPAPRNKPQEQARKEAQTENRPSSILPKTDKAEALNETPDQDRNQDQKKALMTEIKSLLPDIERQRISSGYGLRNDPFSGGQKFHHGVDIPAPQGTAIHAVRKGIVFFSGEQRGYGNVVIIDHGDGFMTKYAHNQANLVKEGEAVDTGSVIARVGTTGKSTGPHIHFEVLYKGRDVSPGTLLAQG